MARKKSGWQKKSLLRKLKAKKLRPALAISTITLFVILGTVLASSLIRGYRPDFKNKGLFPTGLLAANSIPKGALVYVDDKLITATDDTINLPPGNYQIKLVKDGYLPWEKKATIKKEVVFQTNAYLFRAAPDLKPITATGATNPVLSPDGLKVVYSVASASAEIKNGIWVSELNQGGFNSVRSGGTKQLARPSPQINWSQAIFIWSPDSDQVLAILGPVDKPSSAYLLAADRLTSSDQLRNVSLQLPFILDDWQKKRAKELSQFLEKLPPKLEVIATQSAALITSSPHEKKFFYLATKQAVIPENLLPHPPARSEQPEEREIKPGKVYAYNLEDDTNFFIADAKTIGIEWKKLLLSPAKDKNKATTAQMIERYIATTQAPIHWLSTNNHLLFIEDNQIKVIEADGTNKQTVFAGPFINGYAFPSPDGNKLIVLTSMHSHLPPNLYQVTIR